MTDITDELPKCTCGEPKWWEVLGHDQSGHTDHYALKCKACGDRYYYLTWREQAILIKYRKPLSNPAAILNGWIAQVLEPYWLHHYSLWIVAEDKLHKLALQRAFKETGIGYAQSPDALSDEENGEMSAAMSQISEEWPMLPEPVLYPPLLPREFNAWFKVSLRPRHYYWEQVQPSASMEVPVPKHDPQDFAEIGR